MLTPKFIALLFIGSAIGAFAQTNIFPASGNVGIGTTSPGTLLDIGNGSTQANMRLVGNRANQWSANVLYFGDEVDSGRYLMNTRGTNESAVAAWRFYYHYSSNNNHYWQSILAAYPSALNSSTYAVGLHDDALYVGTNGNIGIGTTSPAAKLDLAGNAAIANDTPINPDAFANRVVAGGIADGSGWGLDTAVGGNSGAGHSWALGSNGGDFFMGFQNGSSTSSLLTFLEVSPNRNLYLVPVAGNVGIGTTNPTQKLSVNGTVRAKEVIVDTGWSDYVFADNYKLAPLSEVERHIKADKHLPGLPSAQDVAEEGISLGEMQAKLLAKIEELTLHQIEQEKQLTLQSQKIDQQTTQLAEQSARIDQLDRENHVLQSRGSAP